ncbi:MAG: hypothetical protein JOZ17_00990 [Acetobacteraceae bacterium]|nr:hypothetical protein [Acetobacteraceae bacterium]
MVLREAWRCWVALGGAFAVVAALTPLARAQDASSFTGGQAATPFAQGQDVFDDVRKTCQSDYHAKCTGNDPPYDIMVACLNQYFLNLSPGCQEVLRNAPRSSVGVGYGSLPSATTSATPGGPPGSTPNSVPGAMQNPMPNPMQNPSPGVAPPEEKLRR